MFRDVPECSGMFHVPDFIDAPWKSFRVVYVISTQYVKRSSLIMSIYIRNMFDIKTTLKKKTERLSKLVWF